jgi:hypothetical protein
MENYLAAASVGSKLFFLDGNCDIPFDRWFSNMLPCNGGSLDLRVALDVILKKLRQQCDSGSIHLFLGIDDYQKIKRIGAQPKNKESTCLRELVEVIGTLISYGSSELILLPMFAGTDLSVINTASIPNSSFLIERLPMTLLTLEELFKMIENHESYRHLLNNADVLKHLFFLGGVPRWIVDFLLVIVRRMDTTMEKRVLKVVEDSFKETIRRYVSGNFEILSVEQKILLAAYSISGQVTNASSEFVPGIKWSKLRDSSLCLLIEADIETAEGYFSVHVPYSLFVIIARFPNKILDEIKSPEQLAFVQVVREFHESVDSLLFLVQPWQLWERFGAYFYALRVNALLLLGRSVISVREFLNGALVATDIANIKIKLVLAQVFLCKTAFGPETIPHISSRHDTLDGIDWIERGFIVVNGNGGGGVDIFFAETVAADNTVIVFLDQRKRVYGKLHSCKINSILDRMSIIPDFLKTSALVVNGVMSCVSIEALGKNFEFPLRRSFLISREQSIAFHGSLAYHPACNPCVSINTSSKTALKTAFKGTTDKGIDKVVEKVLSKRKEISGGFHTREELQKFLDDENENLELIDDQFLEFGC